MEYITGDDVKEEGVQNAVSVGKDEVSLTASQEDSFTIIQKFYKDDKQSKEENQRKDEEDKSWSTYSASLTYNA